MTLLNNETQDEKKHKFKGMGEESCQESSSKLSIFMNSGSLETPQ